MKTIMHYYVAESINSEKYGHLTNLIKRCDTLKEAQDTVRSHTKEWREEGLHTRGIYTGPELWGAQGLTALAYDPEYGEETRTVKHQLLIFATPIFMAGGTEGL